MEKRIVNISILLTICLVLFGGVPYASAGLDIDEIRKAARQGDADAQYQLGIMYNKGEDVSQDVVTAYAWFSLAADQGNAGAERNRDVTAKEFTAEQCKKAQAIVDELHLEISTHMKPALSLRFGQGG